VPYLSVSGAELYRLCLSTINCTGKNVSSASLTSLSIALDGADGNKFLCSEDARPRENTFYIIIIIIVININIIFIITINL